MNKVIIDNVRSPKNGYDFKEKSEYRLKVWSIFAEKIDTKTAKVLFLPYRVQAEYMTGQNWKRLSAKRVIKPSGQEVKGEELKSLI